MITQETRDKLRLAQELAPRDEKGRYIRRHNVRLLERVTNTLGATDGDIGPSMVVSCLDMIDAVKADHKRTKQKLEDALTACKRYDQLLSDANEKIAAMTTTADTDGAKIHQLTEQLAVAKQTIVTRNGTVEQMDFNQRSAKVTSQMDKRTIEDQWAQLKFWIALAWVSTLTLSAGSLFLLLRGGFSILEEVLIVVSAGVGTLVANLDIWKKKVSNG